MITYENNQTPRSPHKFKKPLILGAAAVGILIVTGLLLWWWQVDNSTPAPQTAETPAAEAVESPETTVVKQPAAKPEFDNAAIKKALSSWVGNHSGTYAVVITDKNGKVIAEHNPDKTFFAASLYKLLVAYEGYRKVDDGTHKLAQPYLNNLTRGDCLNKMIRESHSPCAEKMWTELGSDSLNAQMQAYGLSNTSMTPITTTARDIAIILARIQQGQGLKPASRKLLLAAMKAQKYDKALKAGFANQTVYDKVGFRDLVEYHDAGIVSFDDGRVLIVSVLTQHVGTRNIAGLGEAIATAAKKP